MTTKNSPRPVTVRPVTVGLALVLIAVPTGFGIFPEALDWSLPLRGLFGGGWLLVAALAAVSAGRHEKALEESLRRRTVQSERLRTSARHALLQSLFRPEQRTGLGDYEWTVYVWDEELKLLVPTYPDPPTDLTDPRIFRAGLGATGLAFSTQDIVVITGDAVSSGQHGLTVAQQNRFRDYEAVASAPIRDDEGRLIGALSAIGRVDDQYFESDTGIAVLRQLADTVGVLLAVLSRED